MKRTIRSSRIIIINSILMLLLIAFIIVQNIYFIKKNNSTLSNINSSYDRKLDVVMLMSKVVRERSLYMLTMYLSDDVWEQDELFIEFHKLKLGFLKLNSELQSLGLELNERELYKKIIKTIDKTEIIQNNIVERIQSNEDDNIQHDISKNDLPIEQEILANFNSLIAVMRHNADAARQDAKNQYSEIMNYVTLVSVFVFLIAIYSMKRSLSQMVKLESGLIQQAETLGWEATHDALTNVYNRRWLQHKFELFNGEQDADASKHTLLYIDLDEFKPINDKYGHVVGDDFLCGITRELEHCIRQNDTLARMGGDEFAILLENCTADRANNLVECLLSRVKKFSLILEGKKISIAGCSVGIMEFHVNDAEFSEIVRKADTACYTAKNNGKNQSYIFTV